MSIELKRTFEVDKYAAIYGAGVGYTMNKRRRDQSISALSVLLDSYPTSKSLLDVGCGDGQWIQCVSDLFHLDCIGVDPVPGLAGKNIKTAPATSLPFDDNSFDTVTCLDVMEHLVPEDTELALSEMERVSRYCAVITVNNNPSCYRVVNDSELHINIRPYEEWEQLLCDAFGAARRLNSEGANRVFIV